jgi:hypothetical protein
MEHLSKMKTHQKIEEQDLIDLDFEKVVVPTEESGASYDYHYYAIDLLDGPYKMCLISNSDDDAVNEGWYIELFDFPYNRFNYLEELTEFISSVKRVKYYGKD